VMDPHLGPEFPQDLTNKDPAALNALIPGNKPQDLQT
jgi:hypothetical protein